MRLGLAQINSTVGDLAGNRRKILAAYAELVAQGAELVIFPELIVCGYPPRDLLFKRRFVPDVEESLGLIAAAVGDVPAVVGTVEANTSGQGRPVLQRRRLLPPRQGDRHGAQVPAADLRRVRRGPLLRGLGPDHGHHPRRQADRHHDLRGYLDPSDDRHPPALPWVGSGEAAGRPAPRPDDQRVRQPLAQRQGRRAPDPGDGRRIRAGLPGRVRQCGRGQR